MTGWIQLGILFLVLIWMERDTDKMMKDFDADLCKLKEKHANMMGRFGEGRK